MTEPFTRRHFLIRGSVVLAGGALGGAWHPARLLAAQAVAGRAGAAPVLRFGIVTDIHYSDKAAAGSRVYRDSLGKMRAAVAALNKTAKQDALGLAFAVTLGDMIDSPAAADMTPENIAAELGYLKAIEAEWGKAAVERHYVLGNHCVFTLTKEEFFANTKARRAPYSFDVALKGGGALHLVVLDACFVASGAPYGRRNADWRDSNIPASQVKWLGEDLAKTKNPAIIFAHQRLDGDTANGAGDFQVKNAAEVRAVLEKSGKVLAVLQGHSHQNYLETVNGIPYCVLRAMVEDPGASNNAFASVEVFADHSVAIRGNFRQASYANLASAKSAISPPAAGAS